MEKKGKICPACGVWNKYADDDGFTEHAPRAYHAKCWRVMTETLRAAAVEAANLAGEGRQIRGAGSPRSQRDQNSPESPPARQGAPARALDARAWTSQQ